MYSTHIRLDRDSKFAVRYEPRLAARLFNISTQTSSGEVEVRIFAGLHCISMVDIRCAECAKLVYYPVYGMQCTPKHR